MKKYFIIFFIIVGVLSCSRDEKLVDNTIDNWKLLVSINDEYPRIEMISLPDRSVINSDIFFSGNSEKLKGIVTKIVEFRENLYLFIPDLSLIEIINKETFKRVATLDFSILSKNIGDICFPNATDAYLTHPNDSSVSLIDLTNFKIARNIKVGNGPSGITCAGNQIFVANTLDNTVSIIDSRTHQEEDVKSVAPFPLYLDVTLNGKYAIAISVGNGKLDSLAPKSPAIASYINISTRNIDYIKEIGNNTVKAIDAFPKGIIIPSNIWAFLPVKDYLLLLDSRTGAAVQTYKNLGLLSMYYNYKRNEVVCFKFVNNSYKISTINPTNGQLIKEYQINDKAIAVLPL